MNKGAANFGFLRVAAVVPPLKVADPEYNAGKILELAKKAVAEGAAIIVFPELSVTGYTAADLFQQNLLLEKAEAALKRIQSESKKLNAILIVGLPLVFEGKLFNVAAVLGRGKIYGFVPKTHIPGYKEFYEERWFAASRDLVGKEINFAGREGEYQKQYSVWYYPWMKESLGVGDEVLEKVITSSNVNWAAEHIFEVNYREFWLEEKNGVLYSPDYGSETLIQMADNAILIREKAGANLERAEAEKQGIIELERILAKTKIGQAVVLISPPDPNDKNMAGYNMVYIYERQGEGKIRATAIRDEVSSVRDLQVLANSLSG